MSGVRRTTEGIELSTGWMKTVLTVGAFVTMLAAFGARVYSKAGQIENALPRGEFYDTTRVIRSDLQELTEALRQTSRNTLALQCRQANYPAGFCDEVPRTTPAGRPR